MKINKTEESKKMINQALIFLEQIPKSTIDKNFESKLYLHKEYINLKEKINTSFFSLKNKNLYIIISFLLIIIILLLIAIG